MTSEVGYGYIAGFAVFFCGLWMFICALVAVTSGWRRLAELYRTEQEFTGEKWTWESAQMGWSNFRGCLVVGANRHGLYLRVQFPFHWFCPPLFVPWSAIQVSEKRMWFFRGLSLRLGAVRPVSMWVRASLGEKLRRASM